MNDQLNIQEIEYLLHTLHCSDSFTKVRGEQVITPGVDHNRVKEKLENLKYRMTM